jgi:hypothetical protein
MSNLRTPLFVALAAIFAFGSIALAGNDWKPIEPAELALKAGIVDKDADAEALFWEVKVDDGDPGELVFSHYLRIKIFNERGKDGQSKVDIPFFNGTRIRDLAARTVKADGTVIELKKDDIFERTIVKVSGTKYKAKSFAVPGIEPGVILEYKWKEVRENSANYVRLQFQREIPVEKVTYLVKPYSGFSEGMKYEPFQLPKTVRFEKAKDGFYSASLTNVPAYIEESRMPPEDSVRGWILIYYADTSPITPEKYWKDFGKKVYDATKSEMKVNDDVRAASTQIIGDATTPEQKLERIYEFCHTKIKNLSSELSGLTREERAKRKPNKSPADTLTKKAGTSGEINMLFAALVSAAGLDARPAWVANRSDILFSPTFANPYFLFETGSENVGVKVGESWKFFDPGRSYVLPGMLRWEQEGQQALVMDSKEPAWVPTPLSAPEKTVSKHKGKFRLLEDGTLEGDVHAEFLGQLAIEAKNEDDGKTEAEREASLRADIKGRLSTAELSNIKIENVTDPSKPYTYSYHVVVPGYAERTGKRLFLQPEYFKKGVGAMFSAATRKNLIYFHYPWSEDDDIEITLPDGFALDNADAPAPFGAKELSQYKISIGVTKDNKLLVYKRNFFFGGGGTSLDRLLYPVSAYPALKNYFDMVHKNDDHTITLKQSSQAANTGASN